MIKNSFCRTKTAGPCRWNFNLVQPLYHLTCNEHTNSFFKDFSRFHTITCTSQLLHSLNIILPTDRSSGKFSLNTSFCTCTHRSKYWDLKQYSVAKKQTHTKNNNNKNNIKGILLTFQKKKSAASNRYHYKRLYLSFVYKSTLLPVY